jgi:hypothetical protein
LKKLLTKTLNNLINQLIKLLSVLAKAAGIFNKKIKDMRSLYKGYDSF